MGTLYMTPSSMSVVFRVLFRIWYDKALTIPLVSFVANIELSIDESIFLIASLSGARIYRRNISSVIQERLRLRRVAVAKGKK